MRQTLIRLFCLLVAISILGGIDCFIASSLSKVDPASELARMRLDDELRVKRHLRICAQAEIISRSVYEVASALSGYAFTKSKVFEDPYNVATHNLPIRIADLKHICSDSKFELVLAEEVDKQAKEILRFDQEMKEKLDGPASQNARFSDFFAKLRPRAEELDSALRKLKESDFEEVNRALQVAPQAPPQTEIVIVVLALVNAIYGCIVGGVFAASFRQSKLE